MDARTQKEGAELLTVQDAAREAGITEDAVRKALAQGRLPHILMYGRKLIRREDFAAYRQSAKPGRPRKQSAGGAPS